MVATTQRLQMRQDGWLGGQRQATPTVSKKNLLASHQGVTLIEDLCGTETSNPHPWQGASFYSSFNGPQRKIPIAGSDTLPNSALLLNTYLYIYFSPFLLFCLLL